MADAAFWRDLQTQFRNLLTGDWANRARSGPNPVRDLHLTRGEDGTCVLIGGVPLDYPLRERLQGEFLDLLQRLADAAGAPRDVKAQDWFADRLDSPRAYGCIEEIVERAAECCVTMETQALAVLLADKGAEPAIDSSGDLPDSQPRSGRAGRKADGEFNRKVADIVDHFGPGWRLSLDQVSRQSRNVLLPAK